MAINNPIIIEPNEYFNIWEDDGKFHPDIIGVIDTKKFLRIKTIRPMPVGKLFEDLPAYFGADKICGYFTGVRAYENDSYIDADTHHRVFLNSCKYLEYISVEN